MKTIQNLSEFYQQELLPVLRPFEERRVKLAFNLKMLAVNGAAIIAAALTLKYTESFGVFLLVILGIWLIITGFTCYSLYSGFKSDFKDKVIGPLVKFIDENLNYLKDAYVPQSIYNQSRIFLATPDRYRGEDYVFGKQGKTEVQFSEIHSEYKTQTRDSKGNVQTQWHTIFKGLFFTADFNKNFSGCTVVLPDTAEKLLGFLGKTLQSMNMARDKLINLEDPEFEKEFAVYSDDQVTARYILSTSMMERLTAYKRNTGRPVSISFVNSRIFVAVSCSENMFEPKIFGSLIDFETVKKYYESLEFGAGLVEILDLNTRIWTKK
ncbi:MAG: DUF3137 domain-containing protein [Candidatus Firestonebacteria bacterium]